MCVYTCIASIARLPVLFLSVNTCCVSFGFCVVFGWLGLSAKAGLFSLVERVRGIAFGLLSLLTTNSP